LFSQHSCSLFKYGIMQVALVAIFSMCPDISME
jgi:hypothetical protein